MKSVHNLGGFACIGATRTLTLQPIPDIGSRGSWNHLTHILIEMRLDITTLAAGSVTVRQLYEYLAGLNIQILGRPACTSVNGWDLHTLNGPGGFETMMLGDEPAVIGAVVVNAIRTVRIWFPLCDPTSLDPEEGAMPAKLLNEASQITVNTLAAATIGVNATVNQADFAFYALTVERSGLSIPSMPLVGSADVARFATLPGGVYTHLLLVEPTAHFAAADVTSLQVSGDDGTFIRGITTDGLILAWVAQRGAQNWGEADAFRDLPAGYPFIPVIYPEGPQGVRLSRTIAALRGLQLDIQGAAAQVHALYCRREPSTALASDALRALGVSDPKGIAVAPQAGPGASAFVAAERNRFLGRLRVKYALTTEAAGNLMGRIKVAPIRQVSAGSISARNAALAQRLRVGSGQVSTDGPSLRTGGSGQGVWMVGP